MADTPKDPPTWGESVDALAHRVLGRSHRPIDFRERPGAKRSFTYHVDGGRLTIEATDAVAAAVALHTYLRRECGRSVTWDTPLPLRVDHPRQVRPVHGAAEVDQGYYLNFCTTGYTSAYWDWDDWEREIDWMALHGVTMPLTAVGHEAVLFETYTRRGLEPDRVRAFLGGPGYLPWQYMGNLDGFAGPLPASWIDGHRDLGLRILRRQRSLGMTPLLPGFTGHVPAELAPDRTRARTWHGLTTHVLDPDDPRYPELAADIVRVQRELFGTDHLYAIDPFIEMVPVDADPGFPARLARATLDGLTSADPHAVWALQTWPFSYQSRFWSAERVTAFLDAIPDERLHLLDLWAEHDPQWSRFDAFGGTPWTWCALLNFGGRSEPIADLQGAVDRVGEAERAEHPPTGIGLAMEGTRNNPAFFELVADQIWWRTEDVVADWLPDFVRQRYGSDAPALLSGWRGLAETVLGASGVRIFPEQFNGVLTRRPDFADLAAPERHRAEVDGLVWYHWPRLLRAWADLVGAAETDRALAEGPLAHDLVDVAMAVLSRVADRRHLDLVEHAARHREVPQDLLGRFLRVFDDLDALLDTRPEYRFATWEAKATSWATSTEDHRVLADNARRILTVWINLDNLRLDDYAARLWSGLVGGHYRVRWQLWGGLLPQALDEPGRAAARLSDRLSDHAERFLRHGPPVRPAPTESTLVLSRRLLDHYGADRDDGASIGG